MGCFNILLNLLIFLCIYVFLNNYVHGSKKINSRKNYPKKIKPNVNSYKYNVNYCIDNETKYEEFSKSNIITALKMISEHSCIEFQYNSTCYEKKINCNDTCTTHCEKWKRADKKKCSKCKKHFTKCNKDCEKCTSKCNELKKSNEKKCKNCKSSSKDCKKMCEECKKCGKKCEKCKKDYKKCNSTCVDKCIKEKVTCVEKCKEVTLPFIRFFYNRSKTDSDFYFSGSTTLHKEEVYNMEIDVSCNKKPGCIAKKILMYLGLIPTVKRKDRDDYIALNIMNIEYAYRTHYTKLFNVSLYTNYDFSSIGHFSDKYKSFLDRKTYTRKILSDNRVFLTGQEIRPVFSDLKWLDIVYCKSHRKPTVECRENGYPKSDGSKCECPTGYTGDTCEKLQFTGPLCPDGLININDSSGKHPLFFYSNANCTVKLTAPEGKKIRINVEALNCTSKNPCFENDCLQIKYSWDVINTGLCLCGTLQDSSLTSTRNITLIQYTGKNLRNYAFITYQVV